MKLLFVKIINRDTKQGVTTKAFLNRVGRCSCFEQYLATARLKRHLVSLLSAIPHLPWAFLKLALLASDPHSISSQAESGASGRGLPLDGQLQ